MLNSVFITLALAVSLAAAASFAQVAPPPPQVPSRVMTYSAQLANPALYGVLSALTLGAFPGDERFGRDIAPRLDGNGRWTSDAGELLRPAAERSFAMARALTWVLITLILCLVLRRWYRRGEARVGAKTL